MDWGTLAGAAPAAIVTTSANRSRPASRSCLPALVVTRCICTIQICAGRRTLIAEDPLPTDLRNALALIKKERGVRTPRAKKRRSKRRNQI
jgi:hypothetical protein